MYFAALKDNRLAPKTQLMKTKSCLEDSKKPYSHATHHIFPHYFGKYIFQSLFRNSVLKINEYTAMNELSGGVDENLEFYPFCFKKIISKIVYWKQ